VARTRPQVTSESRFTSRAFSSSERSFRTLVHRSPLCTRAHDASNRRYTLSMDRYSRWNDTPNGTVMFRGEGWSPCG